MQLPFTREQFFDLFVAYNEALWPAAVALWTASAAICALRLSACRPGDRWRTLIQATPRSLSLSAVPVIWSAIGGSATFLLGVHADVALPIAGMTLAISSVQRTTPERLRSGRVVSG
jgi:hypothetical protein